MSVWSLLVWALVVMRRPVTATLVATGTALALARKLRYVPVRDAARFTCRGHLAAGEQLARALRRVWWPLAVPLWFLRPARPWLVAAWCAPEVVAAARQRSVLPVADLPLLVVDDLAYGTGVWRGVLRRRVAGPLLPELSGWPQRGDG
jgi:hypothetical protein